MVDTVTISLFSKEKVGEDGTRSFNETMFGEVENIRNIVKGLSDAAKRAGNPPPKIVVSVLLIPDWGSPNNSYENAGYKNLHAQFMQRVMGDFSGLGVEIEDFYHEGGMTPEEKQYMHQLKGNGSNADIIKTRAIINNNDAGNHHLQMDSNTIIKNYNELYVLTFGQPQNKQRDALNASFYDNEYVSAHNKIVYTVKGGPFDKVLKKDYLEYCKAHQNDSWDKGPKMNSIYAKVFAPAISKVGLTYDNLDIADEWHFYPANLNRAEYRLTSAVVTAINMSWATDRADAPKISPDLKAIKLQIGDANCDYQSFEYLVKKYTGYLPRNAVSTDDPQQFYQQLLNLSDPGFDMKLLALYYNHVAQTSVGLLPSLATVFPDTDKGRALTQALFGCDVSKLRDEPNRKANVNVDHQAVVEKIVGIDKATLDSHLPNDYDGRKAAGLLKRLPDYLRDTPLAHDSPEKVVSHIFRAMEWDDLLDVDKLGVDTQERRIYDFFLAVEHGSTIEVNTSFALLTDLQSPTLNQVLNLAQNMLKQSSDYKRHFNYVPNRAELLQQVQQLQIDANAPKSQIDKKSNYASAVVGSFDLQRQQATGSQSSSSSPPQPSEIDASNAVDDKKKTKLGKS